MSAKHKSRQESRWRTIIREQAVSLDSQKKFCKQHGIALSTFQKWKRTLQASQDPAFIELPPPVAHPPAVSSDASGREIEFYLPNGVTFTVRW